MTAKHDGDDNDCTWFPAWQAEQKRMRELLGEPEPDTNEPIAPPTLAEEPRTLQ